jgi:hypothetical protein
MTVIASAAEDLIMKAKIIVTVTMPDGEVLERFGVDPMEKDSDLIEVELARKIETILSFRFNTFEID